MEVALGLYVAASLLILVAGTVPTGQLGAAVAAFALFGLTKVLYDPAVYAYVSDRIPYGQRGRAVGLIELSWSSAWLVGVPASGFLIERLGWQAPWAALILFGGLGLWATRTFLPIGRPRPRMGDGGVSVSVLLQTWRRLFRQRRVVALLSTSFLLSMAIELPFIVYGAWLESAFGLSLSTLGLASIVVGLAEGVSEVGTALLTDRLGKRRSVASGLAMMAFSLLLLPWLAGMGLVGAMSGVVLVTSGFEFAIVSLLPLATELVPEERASVLSLNVMAFGLGRVAGAAGGAWIWQWQGENIAANAAAGAACAVLAAALVLRGMAQIQR
jgi:predicted MFS family arabinose efflux permease